MYILPLLELWGVLLLKGLFLASGHQRCLIKKASVGIEMSLSGVFLIKGACEKSVATTQTTHRLKTMQRTRETQFISKTMNRIGAAAGKMKKALKVIRKVSMRSVRVT